MALAPGLADITQMQDASVLTWETDWSAGQIEAGEFVFIRNLTTGFYGALRLDAGVCPDASQGTAQFTWYLQEDGSADFSTLFSDGFERGDTSGWDSP